MPAYDFTCRDCGAAFEARMSISEKSAGMGAPCPECTSSETKQSFASFMFVKSGSSASSCSKGSCRSCSGC